MKKAKRECNLLDLPEKEQERIIEKAAKEANKEQLDLDKRYHISCNRTPAAV